MSEPCTHPDRCQSARIRQAAPKDHPALAGTEIETAISLCTGCCQLVASVEIRRRNGGMPLYLSAPTLLNRQVKP